MKQHLSYTWHDPNTQFDSELGWSPVPNRSINYPGWGTLSSNSHGFRSAEIDQNKKQIIVLGDSIAWGFGVSDTETFPYYLDKLVSNSGYQVSNLAVSGYDVGQYYLFLKRHLNKFNNLKLVIVVIFARNDLLCTGSNVCVNKRKPLFEIRNDDLILTSNNIKKYCLRNLFSKSYFLSGYAPYEGAIGSFLSKISGDKISDARKSTKTLLFLLQKIHELVLRHGAELLVVLSPSIEDFIERSSTYNIFEYIFNNLRVKHLNYINYIEILKKVDQKELSSLYLDEGHYTKKGNLFLAETIYDYLCQELRIDNSQNN